MRLPQGLIQTDVQIDMIANKNQGASTMTMKYAGPNSTLESKLGMLMANSNGWA